MLGIDLAPMGPDTPPWIAEGGVAVFSPFSADTEYLPNAQQVMINFRVSNLNAMIAQLRSGGFQTFNETETKSAGRFAHIKNPEGNAIEPSEPAH